MSKVEVVKIDFTPGREGGGFRKILFSDGVKNAVTSAAQKIQAEANAGVPDSKGFSMNVRGIGYGGGRWGAFVSAKDEKANAAQSENQVLSKAVHG